LVHSFHFLDIKIFRRSDEENWKTPALNDLVLVRAMISEFSGDIDKTIERLDYLADLESTVLEVMPVSNVCWTVDQIFTHWLLWRADERRAMEGSPKIY